MSHISMTSTGRDTMEYRDGEYSLTISAELQGRGPHYMIRSESINKWNPPHDSEEITATRKREILNNIESWFKNRGISYVVG